MQILLAHGLGRTPLALFGLASELRRAGHRTLFFAYLPPLESLARIVRRLTARLRLLARRGEPVGLIGHSLGGLLLRMSLPKVPELKVHHLVTLGTPHSAPRIARFVWRWFPPFRLYSRDCGRLLTSPDALANLPPITVPYTLIAGTAGPCGPYSPYGTEPNDGVVTLAEARLTGAEPVLVPGLHSFLMDAVTVRARILAIMGESDRRAPSPSPDSEV